MDIFPMYTIIIFIFISYDCKFWFAHKLPVTKILSLTTDLYVTQVQY